MITSSYEGLLIASLVFATSRDQCVTSGLLSILALGAEYFCHGARSMRHEWSFKRSRTRC